MDLVKIQRMNGLVKELQKHGIIDTSEEAMAFASKMYNVEPSKEEAIRTEAESSPKADSGLSASEVTQVARQEVYTNNQLLASEFEKLWQRLRALESSLAEKGQKEAVADERNVIEAPEPKVQTQGPSHEKAQQCHPRQGSYTSQDVMIEKIFYCGNK